MISVLGGAFLICVRLFLYEKEQGTIQSKIEDLWDRLYEMHPKALARHLALMRALAHGVTVSFDNIFGVSILSLESIMVTLWLSFFNLFFVVFLDRGVRNEEWETRLIWVPLLDLGLASLPLLIRLAFTKRRKNQRLRRDALNIWVVLSFLVFLWQFGGTQIGFVSGYSDEPFFWYLFIVLYASILIGEVAYFLSIAIIRRTFRAIEKSKSFVKPIFLCFLNLTPALVVLLVGIFFSKALNLGWWPFTEKIFPTTNDFEGLISLWASHRLFRIQAAIAMPIVILILFEVVFCMAALLFLMFGVFLIGHRMFWPVMLRLLYATKRYEIVSKGRVLLIFGALLIILGLGKIEWLVRLLEMAH